MKPLDRQELFLQSIDENVDEEMISEKSIDDLTVTVPIHQAIFYLEPSIRQDLSLVKNSVDVVKDWYTEDINYYLSCLKLQGRNSDLVKGYEKFNKNWNFSWEPDDVGFLQLKWYEIGRTDKIKLCLVPVEFSNFLQRPGVGFTPEYFFRKNDVPVVNRSIKDADILLMQPNHMAEFGRVIDSSPNKVSVLGYAFCSSYLPNVGKALAMRNLAVYYHNKLFEKAKLLIN